MVQKTPTMDDVFQLARTVPANLSPEEAKQTLERLLSASRIATARGGARVRNRKELDEFLKKLDQLTEISGK